MNEKVAVVTDSTCDLDKELIHKYNIHVLPLNVIYSDEEEYLDRVDISPKEIYDRMPGEVPSTSLPSPANIINLFKKLEKEGFTHVISIHISSGLSGTYNAVRTIARDFKNMVIEVIDSKALSLGLGIPVLEAAKSIKETMNFDVAVKKAKDIMSKTEIYFVVGTLDYLRKGGRIGYVAGTIGEIMQIKPIISINEEGKYYTFDKVRGRKKSLHKLFEITSKKIESKKVTVAVMHGGAGDEAKELLDKIKQLPNVENTYTGQVGPVIGVHAGPGLIGVCIIEV
ncbi:degV family protein [Desulforamulus reducens MI-1]|uniref:DegV family protein n=1 Tax=Desulforamulus reducens (strain ATCC BAA-1160 / DSM 100696 / MI-1) TaxID=349161 RepID=A4J9R5_DESRM|nr:DegV family protein [Desulforamulus reducens]ABO51818.1 degV family protein [Desulforamulus reducens MI-1]